MIIAAAFWLGGWGATVIVIVPTPTGQLWPRGGGEIKK